MNRVSSWLAPPDDQAGAPTSARFTNAKTNSERTLNMARLSAFTESNLDNQGFGKLDEDTKSRVALPLRFTPAVATTLIVIGLVLQSPIWLGSMALVAFSGALLPRGMVIDLVYNLGVRHLFSAPPLPSTPKPRQFSYLLSAILLSGSALSFYYGISAVSYTHLRAHETRHDLVCRL